MLPRTGGEFWHVLDVSLKSPAKYVIDFTSSSVVGTYTHFLFNKDTGQLIELMEGGILSKELNPYFLRHGRNIELPAGNFRIVTKMDSPFLLAQPKPALFNQQQYIKSIKTGNTITMLGLGVFLGLGAYYFVLGITRRDPTDYLYATFILCNLVYNGTALNVFSDVFNIKFFYSIGFPIMVSNIAYIGFVMNLLKISKPQTPLLYHLGIAAMALLGAFWLIAPFIPNYSLEFARIGVGVFAVYGISSGIIRMINGLRIARYYLIANTAFIVPGIIAIVLNSINYSTILIEHVGLVAVSLEVILLSLVLNMQLSTVYKEKSASLYATEEALKTANEAIRTKERFLANISHELRTPLNAIQGSIDLLPEEKLDSEDLERLNIIRHSSNFLLFLINDILDLAKLNANKLLLDKHPIDLPTLINQVGSIYQAIDNRSPSTIFRIEIGDNVPRWVMGDEKRIEQVIANLLSNAYKFTNKGYVLLSVSVVDDYLRFSVQDTGIGIQSENLDSMFEEFTQADSSISRQYGGTGLGLRISSRLVELMGGHLKATSKPGIGSDFYFNIPLEQVQDILEPSDESSGPKELNNTFSGYRIAVVDDNSVNLKVMSGLLNKLQINGLCFNNADDALQFFQENPVDLVMMDVQMPHTDGLTATKILRKRSFDKPIIAFTARSELSSLHKRPHEIKKSNTISQQRGGASGINTVQFECFF
ncbi:MAG: ATP-binding protein [Reinekea sp.]